MVPLGHSTLHSIHIDNKRPFYTNGDVLRGEVELILSKDLETKAVDVKLCCREIAVAEYWTYSGVSASRGQDVRKRKIVSELERLIGDASGEQKHVLPAGKHYYRFEFHIPTSPEAQLSSFEGFLGGGVRWYVKLVIRRAVVQRNLREIEPIILIRRRSIADRIPNTGDMVTANKAYRAYLPGRSQFNLVEKARGTGRQSVDLQLRAVVPKPYMFLDGANRIPITLTCSEPGLMSLNCLEIQIEERIFVMANSYGDVCTRLHNIYRGPLKQAAATNVLDRIHEGTVEVRVPPSMCADFQTDLHRVTDRLIITVQLSSTHSPRHKTSLDIATEIHFWDGVPSHYSSFEDVKPLSKEDYSR